MARLLAMALNRTGGPAADFSPDDSACQAIWRGDHLDVTEIDGASHNSVEEIRELRERCVYAPALGRYRIFIIDEVHMLSKSAFNALLKTLEEPPDHVKFLLATTETHKIPETILSRVLKFDLSRVDVNLIMQYLSSICNQESILANSEVLSLIAKAADGSIRDGLSILDQAINISSGNEIHILDMKEMLGFSDDIDMLDLLGSIISGNVKSAINKSRDIIKGNVSSEKVANILLDYIHAMSCIKNNVEITGVAVPSSAISKITAMANDVSIPALSRIWQMLIRGIDEIKICDHPEIIFEMIITRIAYASNLPDLCDILKGAHCNDGQNACSDVLEMNAKISSSVTSEPDKKVTSIDNKVVELSSSEDSLFDEAQRMFQGSIIQ
jgi:DNA polymerase-3 subunit gamma/tau